MYSDGSFMIRKPFIEWYKYEDKEIHTSWDEVDDVTLEARPKINIPGSIVQLGDAGVHKVQLLQDWFPAGDRHKDNMLSLNA